MSVQGKDLRVEFDIVARGGKWEGTAGFPDLNAKEIPLTGINVQGTAVTFGVSGAPGDPTFKGTLSADGKTLSGDFTQGPASGTFTAAWKGEGKVAPAVKNAAIAICAKIFMENWSPPPRRRTIRPCISRSVTTVRLI